jgi:ABC-type nitrate/sulfonate/bicarbonate transport system substrate-binding protein
LGLVGGENHQQGEGFTAFGADMCTQPCQLGWEAADIQVSMRTDRLNENPFLRNLFPLIRPSILDISFLQVDQTDGDGSQQHVVDLASAWMADNADTVDSWIADAEAAPAPVVEEAVAVEPVAVPEEVRIVDLLPNAAFAARYAAMGIGAFDEVEEQFGTKITITEIASPRDSLVAMVEGQYDMSISSLVPFIKLAAAGKDLKVVFAPFIGGGGLVIGAKKWEEERGTDLSKFDGAQFGYTREGSASQLYFQLATERSGLVWEDQNKNAFGQTSAAIPLLEAGRVDLIATDPTTAARAIELSLGYVVLNYNDLETSEPLIGKQIGVAYGFNQSFIDEYPEVTAAVVEALVKGLAAINEVGDDADAVLALFPEEIQAQLADGWATSWSLVAPGILGTDGSMPDDGVTDSVDFSLDAGKLTPEEAAIVDDVVDNSFVEQALANK